MVVSVPYENLTHTLQCIKLQVLDSLDFADEFLPTDIQTPQQLFYFLKSEVQYKHDPKGVELLQCMQTLMDRNGFGDCDCFTITSLASMYILGFKPMYVALVGNSPLNPTHIYTEVYDREKGKICAFDLTNPVYNMQRKTYKFKQRLLFRL